MDAEIFITFVIVIVAMIVTNVVQSCRISRLEGDVTELKSKMEEINPTYSRPEVKDNKKQNFPFCPRCGIVTTWRISPNENPKCTQCGFTEGNDDTCTCGGWINGNVCDDCGTEF